MSEDIKNDFFLRHSKLVCFITAMSVDIHDATVATAKWKQQKLQSERNNALEALQCNYRSNEAKKNSQKILHYHKYHW